MKSLYYVVLFSIGSPLVFMACQGGGSSSGSAASSSSGSGASAEAKSGSGGASGYDPTRGEGKFDASNVSISGFDAAMADKGKAIAGTKCLSCHKTSDEKLVGPGWKGVTKKRTPYWIMNFVTNPDPMIDKDPEVQAQLELCLVRMPNQNIVEEEARAIVEYMRQIDGAK